MLGFQFEVFSLVVLAVVTVDWMVSCESTEEDDGLPKTSCQLDPDEVERAFEEFINIEDERTALERRLINEGKFISPNKRIADLSIIRQKNEDLTIREKELKQIVFLAVTDKLAEKHNLTSEQIIECLPSVSLSGKYASKAKAKCLRQVFSGQCDPDAFYRTQDGTCNNLKNPLWGSALNCFDRILPPRYSTGASGIRQSVKGGPLPEPRRLSLNVHSHLDVPTRDVSHMFMFFGQILDHDMTQAATSLQVDFLGIQCCAPEPHHPHCLPIAISPDDPFYKDFGMTCMNVVRAAICPTCSLGPRQQMNRIAAFIDASPMYGSKIADTLSLRANDGTGKMRVEKSPYGDLLPPSLLPFTDQCSNIRTKEICFGTGDPRANEHPPLSSLHTMLVREHNRLADGLRDKHPDWDGDTVFQEARRIVGAEMQVIVYKEFLPIVLGEEVIDKYELRISNRTRTEYEEDTNPTIFNEFNAAAYRFGHSLINSVLASTPLNSTNGTRFLRDQFFQPFDLRKGILSPIVMGITKFPAQEFDRHLVPDVTNFLYRIRGTPSGLDLASINIQRGRDCGIATYADMVRHCSGGNTVLETFKNLVTYGLMTEENAGLLDENYENVNDIDLWTGMLSEIPNKGAIVGPTAACMLGAQFRRLKFGDRFYFEHKNQIGSFTYPQLEELKQTTLSKFICRNTDIKQLSENAFLLPSDKNPLLDCTSVKPFNFTLWK